MPSRLLILIVAFAGLSFTTGCASMKQSDTARTGIEQLLVSSAADAALDKVDLRPIANAKVFLDTKYLDCVDKNYVILSMRQRLMRYGCTLVDKVEDSQVVIEVASGGLGTDRNELFVGTAEIPLPPPSPVAIPRLALLERNRSMGTAKLMILAYDTQSKVAVINNGCTLARSDHKTWNVLGLGGVNSGTVHEELATHAGDIDTLSVTDVIARGSSTTMR